MNNYNILRECAVQKYGTALVERWERENGGRIPFYTIKQWEKAIGKVVIINDDPLIASLWILDETSNRFKKRKVRLYGPMHVEREEFTK